MNEHTKTIKIDPVRGLVYGDGSPIPAEALDAFISLAQCQLRIAQGIVDLERWLEAFQRSDKLPNVTWTPA